MLSTHLAQFRIGLVLLLLVPVCAGCVALPTNPASQARSLVPTRYKVETGPYAIYTNSPLSKDSAEVRELIKLEDQLQTTLDLKVDNKQDPIEIYILDDRVTFNHFLTFYYSELPPRRAFFFAQGNRRVVYTFHGKSLEQDLRHEATHALLHATVANLPLWLDEGLAEYFEVEGKLDGLNPEHLGKLRTDLKGGWEPDLARLETVDDVRQMGPRDYREAWAWTHYFLESSNDNKRILLTYLRDISQGQTGKQLSARLGKPETQNQEILAHLSQSRETMIAHSRSLRHETLRFQDDAVVTASATAELPVAQRPAEAASRGPAGFFRRLFAPFRSR